MKTSNQLTVSKGEFNAMIASLTSADLNQQQTLNGEQNALSAILAADAAGASAASAASAASGE